ncbi:hypothetical protein Aple_025930 [Acrocarpospora pleiomorpha]|uniref:Luciferase-like domain-containing protein n=1 Tax=Acrocarpospora pleiomorpha TaxID=90975 RepID=A0A5M3XDK3_9ACTN|nr:LLM class flavin-dependent oxidoreductase [Acrocarpospora pleiomorpha]GES19697.1 hypothetical protein Aple_025930 [Acrocarpospora pleiomorpha]
MKRLSIGVMFPSSRSEAVDVRACARHAEDLGLDALFTGDHLAASVGTRESTLTLATVAAVTERLRIGFGVMVLALRHPAWAAKQIATLQHLSGDRVILGVGSGGAVHGSTAWEAVEVPYAERGRRTDAALEVLPDLVTGRSAVLRSGVPITLTPGATMPPVWVGGGSRAALRRAARYADAWFPSMITATAVAEGRRELAELAATYGRPIPHLAVGGSVLLGPAPSPSLLSDATAGLTQYGVPPEVAAHLPITGPPPQAAERFREYAEAGADHLVLGVIGDDWQHQCELIAEARSLAELP